METNNSDNYVLVLEDRSQAKSADEAGKISVVSSIDKNGKIVISPKFDMAGEFHEGLAVFRTGFENESKYGYIGKDGCIAIEAVYDFAGDFENGKAMVFVVNELGGESFCINIFKFYTGVILRTFIGICHGFLQKC